LGAKHIETGSRKKRKENNPKRIVGGERKKEVLDGNALNLTHGLVETRRKQKKKFAFPGQ